MLLGGLASLTVAVVFLVGVSANTLARHIPFRMELQLTKRYQKQLPAGGRVDNYLQKLADRLAEAERLPADMSIMVHYVDDDTVNALATLGGNVVVFRGLLRRLPNENALAMVLAHEIAHVKHRDPIAALGRGLIVGLALATIADVSGTDVTGNVLGQAGLLTDLHFSRAQEAAADRTGLSAVDAIYGTVAGADGVFKVLLKSTNEHGIHAPQFLSTHPGLTNRIGYLDRMARQHGWKTDGRTTPLPDWLHRCVKSDGASSSRQASSGRSGSCMPRQPPEARDPSQGKGTD